MAKLTKRQRDEQTVANNCVTALAEWLSRELDTPCTVVKDGQPYIEFHTHNKSGSLIPFMRIDVLCRIFEVAKD